ncbi:hypothetical protein FH972_022688 [Carpinus fangiana]|uniref:UBC core domain-containing protein n=1 Tax=Carpinus fangiana TaxID=176857 RepID=A0A5N6KSY8_9ROSI|nr:hypothetical protein FH972_022688 [Carpinus fangiana]
MSTLSPHNTRNPTIKRIQREALELTKAPSPDFTAFPLETNLFEWHFTLRGPPAPSPYASGIYHGRIVLPPTYPLRPPSFRFLTPSGRFEVNREICLSISGHHEESWQPAWGIRTALVAIRSFMDTDAKGQLGGVDANAQVRARFAAESRGWRCSCAEGKSNEDVMREVEESCRAGDGARRAEEEAVPEELRLGYRDELGKGKEKARSVDDAGGPVVDAPVDTAVEKVETVRRPPEARATLGGVEKAGLVAQSDERSASTTTSEQTAAGLDQRPRPAPTILLQAGPQAQRQQAQPNSEETNWLDFAIAGVAVALVIMVMRKVVQYL